MNRKSSKSTCATFLPRSVCTHTNWKQILVKIRRSYTYYDFTLDGHVSYGAQKWTQIIIFYCKMHTQLVTVVAHIFSEGICRIKMPSLLTFLWFDLLYSSFLYELWLSVSLCTFKKKKKYIWKVKCNGLRVRSYDLPTPHI